jgi:pimeloyl-ACP methyl ester carboxylesterase
MATTSPGPTAIDHEIRGPEGLPPILWLHGLYGPGPDDQVIDRLAARHRVVVPTFPGFDKSPRPGDCDTVDDLAHLCLELLERLKLRDVSLIGCSFGGWVAAEMAVWRPERLGRLILVDALGIRVGGVTDRDIADLFVVGFEERRALLFHQPEHGGPLPPDLGDGELLRRLRSEEASVVYGWEPYMCEPKLRGRLASVTMPACVIWGAEDQMVKLDYGQAYAAALPNSTLRVLADAGHNSHIEQPDAFIEMVEGFIAEDSSSPSPTTP